MLCTHKTASSASLVVQKFVPALLTHISPNSRPFLVGIVSCIQEGVEVGNDGLIEITISIKHGVTKGLVRDLTVVPFIRRCDEDMWICVHVLICGSSKGGGIGQTILTEVCYLLEVSWQMCHAWITHWTVARAILTMSRRRSTRDERTHG